MASKFEIWLAGRHLRHASRLRRRAAKLNEKSTAYVKEATRLRRKNGVYDA